MSVTANLGLPLPDPGAVSAKTDVARIRDALIALDSALTNLNVDAYTKSETDNLVAQAKSDGKAETKAELLGGAGPAHDTLQELVALLGDNDDAIAALTTLVGTKADANHGHSIDDVTGLQASLDGKMDANASVGVEPGTVQMFAGASAPTGWLICDGQAVSRSAYASLFAAISTTWGAGDGSTTFNLPDMRGRSPVGAGQGAGLTNRSLGATGGEEIHTLTINEMPSHNHSYTYRNTSSAADGSKSFVGGSGTVSGTTGSNGGNQAHNNMQPFAAINYIIKV